MTTDDVTSAGNGTPATNEAKDGQTAAQEPQQERKLKYDYLLAQCQDCRSTRHGTVHFVGGEMCNLTNFVDIASTCSLMDDESAQKFRSDVAAHQKMGRLDDLLPPEIRAAKEEQKRQAKQRRDAKLRELMDWQKCLQEEADSVKAAGLNNRALARTVTDYLEDALSKAGLNEAVLHEMSERDMDIRISVRMDGDREVVDMIIDPQDLIDQDVSDEQADLQAEVQECMNEFAEFARTGR